jgi:ADP-ribosylglycohydrolase
MLGAAAGDIIGSIYEGATQPFNEDFPLAAWNSHFTDDTVLTVAVADAILTGGDYQSALIRYARRYPDAGYGGGFRKWMRSDDPRPYNSFGNGSVMRVSPIGWAFDTAADVLAEAERSAAVTHNHPEGIKGAQAVALAIFYARTGIEKSAILREIQDRFGYRLDEPLAILRPGFQFDVTCQGTVPPALIAFNESDSLESAIRKAVSLGGDADTLGAICGSVAEAYYRRFPGEILEIIKEKLPDEFLEVFRAFYQRFVQR